MAVTVPLKIDRHFVLVTPAQHLAIARTTSEFDGNMVIESVDEDILLTYAQDGYLHSTRITPDGLIATT